MFKTILLSLFLVGSHHFETVTPTPSPTINQAPQLKGYEIGTQTGTEDEVFEFDVPVEDIFYDDNELTYSANEATKEALPTWLAFNDEAYSFFGLPSDTDIGRYNISLTATDQGGLESSTYFLIEIVGKGKNKDSLSYGRLTGIILGLLGVISPCIWRIKKKDQMIADFQNFLQEIPKQTLDDNKEEELFKAIENNNLKKVKRFLFAYKDVVTATRYERTPFICAAQFGQLAISKLLKERGANTKEKDKYGNNALHYACFYKGNVEMVTWLLDVCKIGLETRGCAQRTPFLCTAEKGHLAIAKLLKERGANIHAKSEKGNNALHFACEYSRSVEMVTWLLDECKLGLESKGDEQRTPFICAAREGHLEIAKLLKERGANIHAKSENIGNALHWACYSGSVAMINWLLDVCKIGIESKGYAEKTPFTFAAAGGQVELAKLLKERGANIYAKIENVGNALHLACYRDRVPMVTWLLDVCKIGLETKGFGQQTPFIFAAEKGQLSIAKLLKERGANIKAKSESGNNALHLACFYKGNVEMVTWLLHVCKIDIETKGQYQRTPFIFAAEKGQLAIASLLKERGANIHATDDDGNSALHIACLFSESVEMVTWLLDECKIGIESKGKFEITPFLCAAHNGQLAIAKLLKERGANVHAKNEDGNNALKLAKEWNNQEMISYLKSLGLKDD